MTRDETALLLRTRRELTDEPHSDNTIDAWSDALHAWTYAQVRDALVTASRSHRRVTVADVVELLPRLDRPTTPTREVCALCDGTGWELLTPPGQATDTVKPCRCTTGQQRVGAFERAVEANHATLAQFRSRESTPPPQRPEPLL